MSRNKEHRGAAFGGAPEGGRPYIWNIDGYSLYIPYIFHIYIYICVLNIFNLFSLVCIFKIKNLLGKTSDFVKRS